MSFFKSKFLFIQKKKNPVGDQPKDIEIKILQIIRPYIENENSIILAVSKGSDDLANSEALKLAREVDPKGVRTIGVLTQLDLMEQGTDVLNDLQNKTYPLQLGAYFHTLIITQNIFLRLRWSSHAWLT